MDIQKIMDSLERHNVYRIQPGRSFDGKDEPVPDIETIGMTKLLDGYPSGLAEFNKAFKASQNLLRRPRISQMVSHTTLARDPQEAINTTAGVASPVMPDAMDQSQNDIPEFEDAVDSDLASEDELIFSDEDEDELVEALKAAEESEGGILVPTAAKSPNDGPTVSSPLLTR